MTNLMARSNSIVTYNTVDEHPADRREKWKAYRIFGMWGLLQSDRFARPGRKLRVTLMWDLRT